MIARIAIHTAIAAALRTGTTVHNMAAAYAVTTTAPHAVTATVAHMPLLYTLSTDARHYYTQ